MLNLHYFASTKRIWAHRLRWLAWVGVAMTLPTAGSAAPTNTVIVDGPYPCFTSSEGLIDNCAMNVIYGTRTNAESDSFNLTTAFYDWADTNDICVSNDSTDDRVDEGLTPASYGAISHATSTLGSLSYARGESYSANDQNSLASTPTACLRKETSNLVDPIPDDSYRMAMYPPVLGANDLTPITEQLIPTTPIEVQCDGTETYAQCYEKARVAYNNASCNNGTTGSCGTTVMNAAESLDSTLTVAKGFCMPEDDACNTDPSITSTGLTTATEDTLYTDTVTTMDSTDAGENLTIAAIEIPSWLTLEDNGDGTATLSGTPSSDDVGTHAVTLTVTDDDGADSMQTFEITVSAAPAVASPTNIPVFGPFGLLSMLLGLYWFGRRRKH